MALIWLNEKPFTTLWVDGHHENFDILSSIPIENWHGGTVHRVRPNVFHLMRGQLYEIDGLTFFAMDGASSHDINDGIPDPSSPDFKKQYRSLRKKNTVVRALRSSWRPDELMSDAEYLSALDSLEKAHWKVDYVISHCALSSIAQSLRPTYKPDSLTEFFEMVSRQLGFQYWLFGHYHGNNIVHNRFVLQWEQIVRVA